MKCQLSTLAAGLLLLVPSFAQHGLIYTSDQQLVDSAPLTLTAPEARLLIAQRLGLSRFDTLEGASRRTIEAINLHGRPSSTLQTPGNARHSSSLVLIEGIEGLDESLIAGSRAAVAVEGCPSTTENERFLDILSEHRSIVDGSRSVVQRTQDFIKDASRWASKATVRPFTMHSTEFEVLASKYGTRSKEYRSAIVQLQSTLAELLSPGRAHSDVTVILMPKESKALFTRSSRATWGQSSAWKREEQHDGLSSILDYFSDASDQDSEDGDDRSTDYVPAFDEDSSFTSLQSNDTSPPTGILPFCYSSMDSCQSTTHGCSGHGSCQLKYAAKDDGSDCYACSCEPDRQDLGDGRYKTTTWAGPACQKKDVSAPFWLLFTTAVGLLSAVAWGIGLLYSMGSEDLPSVIGAGVAVGRSGSAK